MNRPPDIRVRRVPASHGFAWLVQSLSLLRLQAGRLLLTALLMQVILGLTQLPVLGLLIAISVPALNAGLLESFHITAAGGRPEIRALLKPLATGVLNVRLLALGGLVLAVGVVTMSLLLSGNEGLMDPLLVEQIEQGDLDALTSLNQEALAQIALAFLLGVSISGTLSYFAIPLIWFRRSNLGAALAVGMRALLVNWKAFLALGLGLLLAFVPVAVASGLLFGLVAGGGAMAVLAMGLIMMLVLAFQLVLFGTQYCAFRDVFGTEPQGARPGSGEGQLVA